MLSNRAHGGLASTSRCASCNLTRARSGPGGRLTGLYVYRCNVGDAKNSRSPYSPGPAMAHGTYAHIPKEDAHIASKGRSHTARLP